MRWWVVVVLVLGCTAKRGLEGSTEHDALWRLAPLTATRGVVISSKGLTALESGYRAVWRAIETVPELAPVASLLRQALPAALTGPDAGLAKAGLAANRGLAAFYSKNGTLLILPVANRAAFLEFAHGTPSDAGDTLGDLTCKTVGDRYACARPVELLGRMGKGSLRDQIVRVGERGDIEVALEEDDTRGGLVATFQRGGVIARGALRDKRLLPYVVNADMNADPRRLAGFGVFNVAGPLSGAPMPTEPLAAGITFADLIASMAGPVRLSLPPGMTAGDIRVALKDPKVARTLVEQCEEIPHLAILSSHLRDKVCHLSAPGYPLDFGVSVENNTLRAQVENVPATPDVALTPTALAKELASSRWAFAMYGRGALAALPPSVPTTPEAILALRAFGVLNESGVGIRADGDEIRFVLGVRTMWSNPDAVVAKWLAIPFEHLLDQRGLETARTIATGTPVLADDVASGNAIVFSISALSIVAGFVAPSFVGRETMRELTGSSSSISAEEAVTAMSSFTDAMCACKDAACATRVANEMQTWSTAQASAGKPPPQLSDRDKIKITAIGERLGACMQAAITNTVPMKAEDFIAKHVDFRDRVCSCADLSCGEAVHREMTAWSDAYVKKLPANVIMSKADESRMSELEGEMSDCMISLRAKK